MAGYSFSFESIIRYRAGLTGRPYHLDYVHIRLSPREELKLNLANKKMFIHEADEVIRVESDDGMKVYDLNDEAVRFNKHEHSGRVVLINRSTKSRASLKYVEVIYQFE